MLADIDPDELLPPRYYLDWIDSTSDIVPVEDVVGHPIRLDYRPVPLVGNERVTADDHFQVFRSIRDH